ncbi:hypothetical protein [Ectopseudomonas guguanensis]|jgi:hypothetical protein|uniref:Uncharacterized protein n=1 Tax=Ectopseudomonas guguanensis TaxID=1198456 RepID=A0A1H0X5D5_9GAMM|nr:hypothetical protein [Pseudomonas guguanensis]SDP98112.1 hypothetical protein SAMN05216213_109213 [Pseudomonas guguanensis]
MSELKDQPIEQGVRKRAEYDNAQRKRLVLSVDREDGGKLSLPIAVDMRSHDEEETIQQNTFLAIMPLARLPGHDAYNEAPRGALPRPGRIYVFQNGKLWREVLCDGKGNMKDVDLAHWRKQAENGADADDRQSVGKQQQVLLIPILVQGQSVANNYLMAYSEKPWTWEYIRWLEADPNRIKCRAQIVAFAWSAAVVGASQWRPTQAMPAVVISAQADGFRARDFSIESLLGDPSLFTPGLSALPAGEMSSRMQMRLEELAAATRSAPPQPLPTLAAGADVLAERNMRAYPKLVGLMLDDPLFALRHACAQARLAESYLLTLNALVPHRPNGRYAHALYSSVMQSPSSPLGKFRKHLHLEQLHDAVFDGERKLVRTALSSQLQRLVNLLSDVSLAAALWDWQYTHDERLLEPYQLLSEILGTLGKLPEHIDALSQASASDSLRARTAQLSERLLTGHHPISKPFLAQADGNLPEAVKRLVALAAKKREPDPQRMGMNSLLHIADIDPQDMDKGLVYKNLHALIGDFMDTFSIAVLTQVQRLNDANVKVAIEFRRLFAPTHGVLEKLSPSWRGIQLVSEAQAEASNLRILGVQGEGLRYGLTTTERADLTRKNYRYMNITNPEGQVIGSTSPRQVGRGLPNHGAGVIIAAPSDHPEVIKYSVWKHAVASKLDTAAQSPSLPVVAVACAMYNLSAQVEGMKALQGEAGDGEARYYLGNASALADLGVASGNLSKFILGGEHRLVTFLNKPRLDVSRISTRWAMNLAEQTGNPRLPVLRALSGGAMLFTTAITVWDAKRAWHQGDRDAALAYGAAAAGGAAWTAYALGMCINPVVLIAGATLFIGGSILAGWLVDSDVEALMKNGPFGKDHGQTSVIDRLFGDDQRFAHLSDPHIAYQQLLGILGRPMIQVSRLGDWLDQAPPGVRAGLSDLNRQRAPLNAALECRRTSAQPFERDDWAVRIHSPLLGLFEAQHFQFFAREELGVLPLSGAFNAERTERRPIDEAKLAAQPLDSASVLYILPKQFPVMTLTPLQRHGQKVTQRLKVFGQFRLAKEADRSDELVLPQPSPKTWQPYQAAFAKPPALNARTDEVPYWQIETLEFKV